MEGLLGQLLAEILQPLSLVKAAVAIVMVVGLSLVAEFVSPPVAGIFSGYPLGAAIALFFIGVEMGPRFAAASAVYTSMGLIATMCFAYAYYLVSAALHPRGKWVGIAGGTIAGLGAYVLAAAGLNLLPATTWSAPVVVAMAILAFDRLFRSVANTRIENRIRLTLAVLWGRALAAALMIVVLTAAARLVGPRAAGLLSAFPITMFPFVLIIHLTYDLRHVHAILKNVPRGLFCLVVYCLLVSLTYGDVGIYWGTGLAYAGATAYLVVVTGAWRRQGAKPAG